MAGVAQQVERPLCKRSVRGPTPLSRPTTLKFRRLIVKAMEQRHAEFGTR